MSVLFRSIYRNGILQEELDNCDVYKLKRLHDKAVKYVLTIKKLKNPNTDTIKKYRHIINELEYRIY
jgi:hypothetical protein